jgi:hypothetical protein
VAHAFVGNERKEEECDRHERAMRRELLGHLLRGEYVMAAGGSKGGWA